MAAIPYGKGAYTRSNGSLPPLELRNMYLEATPADSSGVVLLSRKGLSAHATRGSGPIDGIFAQEGTFGGDIFTVSGSALYRGSTLLGSINGTGPVSWAASATEVVVTRGSSAYSYNGTNLAAISLPDSFSCAAVTFIAGLFIFIRAGTHKYYWSAALDARTVDGLSFASAELSPDPLLDAKVMRGLLMLIGESTVEAHFPNGDADLPFTRVDQRLYQRGAVATGCTIEQDNTLFMVGNDRIAYRLADVPERISDHGIEEKLAVSSSVSCFTYTDEGHSFFCVRLDDQTYAYDAATKQWSELSTSGRDNFRGQCAVTIDGNSYFGDDEDGTLWTLDGWADGVGELERVFTAATAIKGGAVSIDSLHLEANVGQTGLLSGQGSEPVIEMRSSRDAGITWGAYRSASLGAQGEYRKRTNWRRCGLFDAPGAIFQFRLTDPVPLRVSGVFANEPGGGRSR